ncbi:hypothetical protein [Winogradskyella wichelsiae]|uniref:hypothetical protein n=1 Tax=Winogradskyella wichelsiae TaxID=2697007 RepID=UPI0015CB9809|nr:hypothetical protein [Winogradskyella wichelsiae]
MEDDILIDNYLEGLLSKNEEKSFLERLKSNEEFKYKFKLEEQLFNALDENSWSFFKNKNVEVNEYIHLLEQNDLQNLKKTLVDANSKFKAKNNNSKRKKLLYYLAAASIVVFLGFQFFFNKTVSNQELYYDYLALNDLPSFVSRSDEVTQLTEGQGFFEDKKYTEALDIFKSLKQQDGTLEIYKGITQAELGHYNDAKETFNNLINSNLLDAEKGFWYKALTYIKADKVEAAKAILAEIISRKLYNHSEAKELLEKIKD